MMMMMMMIAANCKAPIDVLSTFFQRMQKKDLCMRA
jgi:hypothetical protein